MAVEQKDLLRPQLHDGTAQLDYQLNVRHLAHTERAGKEHMMSRVGRPQGWEAEHLGGALSFNPVCHCCHDVRVGGQGQVGPMLFEGAERKENDFGGGPKSFHLGPSQVFQAHRVGSEGKAGRSSWEVFISRAKRPGCARLPRPKSPSRIGQRGSFPPHSRPWAIPAGWPYTPAGRWCSRTGRGPEMEK